MCAVVKKIVSGKELIRKKIVTINTILPNDKYILLKGTVFSPEGQPLPGSAIDIVQINCNVKPPIEKNIGVTFTLDDGSYGVLLLWGKGYSYKLMAYAPA